MSGGQDTYAGYLDAEEKAFNDVMASLSAMKRLLAQQSREVRSWRFKVQNWKRGIAILDPQELENQLSEGEVKALHVKIRSLNRAIGTINRHISNEEYDNLDKAVERVVDRIPNILKTAGASIYEDELERARGIADDALLILSDLETQDDGQITYDDVLGVQKEVAEELKGFAKARETNLMVEVDEGAVEELANEMLSTYRYYPENGLETMLDNNLWNVIGTPDWTEAEGIVEDGDTSSYRPLNAITRAITRQLEDYIQRESLNGDSVRIKVLENAGSTKKKPKLEPIPSVEEKEIRPAQEGVSVTLIEQLDGFLTGPYTNTEGHEDEINELVSRIGHGCPNIEQRAIGFDVARDRSGLSDALDRLDDVRNLFGSQRHSSTGKRLFARLDGAWEACYAVHDKHSLTNAQRRMRSTQKAMLRWWSQKWTQRGGTPDNDNTYKSWKPSGRAKALY